MCHLTSLLWQKFSNIFCKVLQQQSFSTNGTDGDGKHAGICRKRRGCHQRMAFSRALVWRLLLADSFDSSTASPVPGKVENDAKASLPDHTTWNKVSIQDFFIFIFFTSSLASLRVCLLWEKAVKSCGAERGLFSRLTVGNPGEAERFQLRVFCMTAQCHTFKGIKSRRSCEWQGQAFHLRDQWRGKKKTRFWNNSRVVWFQSRRWDLTSGLLDEMLGSLF